MARFERKASEDGHSRASTLELFYDLVFVFAITQVSHFLLGHVTWEGAGQSAVVLLAVWWSWNYTTWATNELDTSSAVVRALVIAVMLGSLLMSIAIPDAWGDRALLFAGSYVAIQIGRHTFMAFVAGARGSKERMRASRILVWFVASGVFWISGALADGPARTTLWLIALAIDYAAPVAVFWVPFMERVSAEAWEVVSEHFAERFQLFVIIALGESIVVTGATVSEGELDGSTTTALVAAFLGSAALWWLYFNRSAEGAQRRLELAENRTVLARDVYTYLHAVIIAGVIASAVGDELVIKNPTEAPDSGDLAAIAAGPVIYLLALALMRFRATGSYSFKRPLAALAIVGFGFIAGEADWSALAIAIVITVILGALIAIEEWDFDRRRKSGMTERQMYEADHGLTQ